MKTRSRKTKGKILCNLLKTKLLKLFPHLTEQDIRATPSGMQGEDIQLSQAALEGFAYGIECKNLAKIAVYKFYEQAKAHVEKINKSQDKVIAKPLVVIKQNGTSHKPANPLVILDLDDFLELVAAAKVKNF